MAATTLPAKKLFTGSPVADHGPARALPPPTTAVIRHPAVAHRRLSGLAKAQERRRTLTAGEVNLT